MKRAIQRIAPFAFGLMLTSVYASAQAATVVTDRPSYNVGSEVRVKAASLPEHRPSGRLTASIRYAGETKPIASHIPVRTSGQAAAAHASTVPTRAVYTPLWRIPAAARAGRYEIDLAGAVPQRNAASFVVYRKFVAIEKIDLGKTFYTSGDPVACAVILRNLTAKP
ncbi:MAG: hypothetical protein ACREH9_08985, partial [Pseudomonadota bacterium]